VAVVELQAGEAELRDLVERYRLLLEAPAPEADPAPLGTRLYRLLLEPLEPLLAGAPRLVVAPDGPLHHLPFAALLRPEGARRPRYLAHWKPLEIAASITAWAELAGRRADPAGRLVVFADPAPSRRVPGVTRGGDEDWPRLPESRREAERLAQLAGSTTRLFIGADATEAAAKRSGSGTRHLHFATHAFLDPVSPLDSALVLAPSPAQGVARDNGLLQAWEVVQDLRLDADLVTLSACESGAGAVVADEGMLGLTRAFQIAGARAVVASLWKVSDRETMELMARFYSELMRGAPADEALRAAQIAAASHPSAWAAFQLYGAGGHAAEVRTDVRRRPPAAGSSSGGGSTATAPGPRESTIR
jgi:CHAT domain-containing protein